VSCVPVEPDVVVTTRRPLPNTSGRALFVEGGDDQQTLGRDAGGAGDHVARDDADSDVHAARPGVKDSCRHVQLVADGERPAEADGSDVCRQPGNSAPVRRSGVRRFVDPPHDPTAMQDAITAHICATHEDVSGDAGRGASGRVRLRCDGILDLCSGPYPNPRLMFSLKFEHGDRRPRLNRNRIAEIVDSDENNWTLGRSDRVGVCRVARVDGDQDVQAAAAGIYQARVHCDRFADADGSGEVEIAHGRGDAAMPAPPDRRGVSSSVDPLQ